jgi:hypothetical protein
MNANMKTSHEQRTERRKIERKALKEQNRNAQPQPSPNGRRSQFSIATVIVCLIAFASVAALASSSVRQWFSPSPPKHSALVTAPNQTAIQLDDGGLAYSTNNRISAFHGENPRHSELIGLQYTEGSVDDTDYHPLLWRSVEMSLKKPDGSIAEVTATRPLWWFEITDAREGATVPLDIHEAGISGMAIVHKITSLIDKPYEPPTPGYHPVIGTIKHLNAKVIELTFQGAESEPLGVTANHPLWSEDREDWIPAGELRIGEMVATTNASARLLRRQEKPGLHTVYNIEVHRTHSYHVGKLGLMAHNTGLECERVFSIFHSFKQKNPVWREAWESVQRRLPNMTVDLRHQAYRDIVLNESPELFTELAASGVNHTADAIVAIGKRADGQTVFLEKGNNQAGLQHIFRQHGSEFNAAGIPHSQIPDLVHKAATQGVQVGMQNTRPIYEVAFMGKTYRVAVDVGSNGFVVGANMRSLP